MFMAFPPILTKPFEPKIDNEHSRFLGSAAIVISQVPPKVSKSNIIFPDLNHVKAYAEDCEHRAFHMQAINQNGARIRISPEIVF